MSLLQQGSTGKLVKKLSKVQQMPNVAESATRVVKRIHSFAMKLVQPPEAAVSAVTASVIKTGAPTTSTSTATTKRPHSPAVLSRTR